MLIAAAASTPIDYGKGNRQTAQEYGWTFGKESLGYNGRALA